MRSRFSPVMPFSVRLRVHVAELLLEQAVDAAGLLLLTKLEQVLALADATAAVLTRRVRRRSIGQRIVSHFAPLRNSFMRSRRQSRHTGPV